MRKEFFSELSRRTLKSEDDVKKCYYALIKYIAYELRLKGRMYLPDLGRMKMQEYEPGKYNISRFMKGKRKRIKFKACEEIINFLNQYGK